MLSSDQFDNKPKVNKLNILPSNPESNKNNEVVGPGRFPSWLHRKLPTGENLKQTGSILNNHRLHTVCEEAKCPNLFECWSKKTATFLIMGKECSRACGFCDIDFSKSPKPLENDEPERVAYSVKQLELKHVVITMVARDDLEDQGAFHIAKIILEVKKHNPTCTIEVLTSDFNGQKDALNIVLDAGPEIFNHNLETVETLTPRVRHKATYQRTLEILKHAKDYSKQSNNPFLVKSGIMVGLGETEEEVMKTLHDLQKVGCDIVTMGQYLQPNRKKLLVKEFIHPDQFKKYETYGHSIGIKFMYCGPFIRSSYNANLVLQLANDKIKTINSD